MIDLWLSQLSAAIAANGWLAPLLALVAGVLTAFTPCSLTNIPLIVGYVGGTGEKSGKRAPAYSALFALGSALTFTVLGAIAGTAGKLIGHSSSWWFALLGLLMVLMALQIWEIFNFIPSTALVAKNKRRGYAGAFIAGILGGIFSSPCSTPVLIALLAIVSGEGSLVRGMVLMLLYGIGHSALVLIAGTSVGLVQRVSRSPHYKAASTVLKIVMGSAILLIGLYMFWLAF